MKNTRTSRADTTSTMPTVRSFSHRHRGAGSSISTTAAFTARIRAAWITAPARTQLKSTRRRCRDRTVATSTGTRNSHMKPLMSVSSTSMRFSARTPRQAQKASQATKARVSQTAGFFRYAPRCRKSSGRASTAARPPSRMRMLTGPASQ